MKLPKARTENLVEQNLGTETLIYDLTTHQAFNLNETLSIVYKACDGKQTFDELKHQHKFTDDFIYLALDELDKNNLLAEEYASPFANTSRREVIKKVGLATMFALPIITGLIAPKAVNAASSGYLKPVEGYCGIPDECVTTKCEEGRCCAARGRGGNILLFSGETVSPSNDGAEFPQYKPLDTPSSGDDCLSQVRCCDGRTPYGTCTYTRVGDEVITDSYGTQLGNFSTSCTCSCPS